MAEPHPPSPSTTSASDLTPPELVFGLVMPLGVNGDQLVQALSAELLRREINYHTVDIPLMRSLIQDRTVAVNSKGIKRMDDKIALGDKLCKELHRKDAFALHAVKYIFEHRARLSGVDLSKTLQRRQLETIELPPDHRVAYVVRSLKRPEEIQWLRRTYGPWVIIISAFSDNDRCVGTLLRRLRREARIPSGPHHRPAAAVYAQIEELLERDAKEADEFGQNSRSAFAQGDLFLDMDSDYRAALQRFIRPVFSDRSYTPTREENAMFHARAAALRSSSPARQVGAAIIDGDGELVSVGSNEVPTPLGGFQWDSPHRLRGGTDDRDIGQHEDGLFSEVARKRDLIIDTLSRLGSSGLDILTAEANKKVSEAEVGSEWIEQIRRGLQGSELNAVIEFQRPVHAEMAAIQNAHAHGTAIRGYTLFCTAFPCHICAKHVLVAGLHTVYYIEPYPKSRALALYPGSIRVDRGSAPDNTIPFLPYIGIGPRMFPKLFESRDDDRMDADGLMLSWEGRSGHLPRLGYGDEDRVSKVEVRRIRLSELASIDALQDASDNVSLPLTID